MNKLPVGKVVLGAYGFTFGHLGTIIGLIWFPVVVSTLLEFLSQVASSGGAAPDSITAGTGAFAVWLLRLLLTAIISVAVTRQALGLRQGPATFYFALGQPEFRLFGAILMVVAAPVLVYSACLVAAVTAAAAMGMEGPMALAVVVLVFIGGPALIYAIVRLSFLVAPVTISENRVDIARGWALTGGNFWRIVAVILAIAAPIYLLQVVGTFVVTGSEIAAVIPPNGAHDAQSVRQYIVALVDIFNRHAPALMGIDLILAPFSLGLSLSASAFAYRELAGAAAPQG